MPPRARKAVAAQPESVSNAQLPGCGEAAPAADQWQAAHRLKLRQAKEERSRGALSSRIKDACFQASFLTGSYFFDWWESCLVFLVCSLVIVLIAHGAARQIRAIF